MQTFQLDQAQQDQFEKEGYIIVPGLLKPDTLEMLKKIARADLALLREAASREDGEGGAIKLKLKNDLYENDIYSAGVKSAVSGGNNGDY
ncbi:MAG: hypothetical protein R3C11_04030 [Planctomycetaceae bacterium]